MLANGYSRVFLLIMAVVTLAKIFMIILVQQEIHSRKTVSTTYTYLGDDYPREWMSDMGPPVNAFITPADVRHYGIAEPEADDEWNALTPNKGIIYLGAEKRAFSLSMFHQLRCLDILRKSIRDRESKAPSELDRHCLNYLRQMALCRSSTELDLSSKASETKLIYSMRTCNNWNAVYNEVRDNLDHAVSKNRS